MGHLTNKLFSILIDWGATERKDNLIIMTCLCVGDIVDTTGGDERGLRRSDLLDIRDKCGNLVLLVYLPN